MDSSNIFVFPCVSRSAEYDLQAKLMSEENITNIIKSITDKESYVISWEGTLLKCVIKGYYFEINNIEMKGNKYAKLHTNTIDNTILLAGDEGTTFGGLTIGADGEDADLVLCENNDIPDESKVKFNRESLKIDTINCGVLN